MFKNYLKIAIRNIVKSKFYSVINVVGLAIGMACCILILLWIQDEVSYDKFHENSNRIYRIVLNDYIGSPPPLAPLIEREIPEITKTARIDVYTKASSFVFSYGDKYFNEDRFFLVDPAFFEMFSFDFITQQSDDVLKDASSIVISESTAKKYFLEENPIGKVLNLEGKRDFVVTGVFRDIPNNSHMQFDLAGSYHLLIEKDGSKLEEHWGAYNYLTYFMTEHPVAPRVLRDKIGEAFTRHTENTNNPFFVQRLTDIHLKSHVTGEISPNGSIIDVYIFAAIALIVLLIACINYMNLATARFTKRTKEIGVRKVIGASRNQLIWQFFGESVIMSIIAVLLSVALVELVLPIFNPLVDKQLHLNSLRVEMAVGLILLALLTGLVAGSYPAFFLSSLKPSNIIKGKIDTGRRGSQFRKSMVVLQFALSIFFFLFAIVISQQMTFLKTVDLGFNRDHIVNIPIGKGVNERLIALKSELMNIPEVQNVSYSNFSSGYNHYRQSTWWEGRPEDDWDMMRWTPVDQDFIKTFDLEVIKGSDFSQGEQHLNQYVLNESAVKYIGWDDPIGKQFQIIRKGEVVGVVKDFNFKSLHEPIQPVALVVFPKLLTHISIRIIPQNVSGALGKIETVWKELVPDRPFDYFFYDESYDAMYHAEQKTGKIFRYAALTAVIISCLGLFGIASYASAQRTKEIGVRKVLGATVASIIGLISREFVILVVIANLITFPIAYYAIGKWLENFAYHIDVGAGVFLLVGILVLVIALLTVGFQAVRAAVANPIDSLRYE